MRLANARHDGIDVRKRLVPIDQAEPASYPAGRAATRGSDLHKEMRKAFMKTRQVIVLIGLSLLLLSSESFAQSGTCAGMDTGSGADSRVG